MKVLDLPVAAITGHHEALAILWANHVFTLRELPSLGSSIQLPHLLEQLVATPDRTASLVAGVLALRNLCGLGGSWLGDTIEDVRLRNLLARRGGLSVDFVLATDVSELSGEEGWGPRSSEHYEELKINLQRSILDLSIFREIEVADEGLLAILEDLESHELTLGPLISSNFHEALSRSEILAKRITEQPPSARTEQRRDSAGPYVEISSAPINASPYELFSSALGKLSQKESQVVNGMLGFWKEGCPAMTLEEIAGRAAEFGFERPVSRQRVAQLEGKARKKLIRLLEPYSYVVEACIAADDLATMEEIGELLGFPSANWKVKEVKKFLEYFGSKSALFPQEISGVTFFGSPSQLERVNDAYGQIDDLNLEMVDAVAERVDVPQKTLERLVSGLGRYLVLDSALGRFFWKAPALKEKTAATRNPVYTAMLRIFALVHSVHIETLLSVLPSSRGIDSDAEIPRELLEAVVEADEDFSLRSGVVEYLGEPDFSRLSDFDKFVGRYVVSHGDTITTEDFYPAAAQAGFLRSTAGALKAGSTFLKQQRRGVGNIQGVYQFIGRREHIRMDALRDDASGKYRIEVECGRRELRRGFFAAEHLFTSGIYTAVDSMGAKIGEIECQPNVLSRVNAPLQAIGLVAGERLIIEQVSENCLALSKKTK